MAKYHDWDNLKLQYLQGENPNVEAFLRSKGINPNGGYATLKTNGWAGEKRRYSQQVLSAYEEKLPEFMAQEWLNKRKS